MDRGEKQQAQRLWAIPVVLAFLAGFILATLGKHYQIDLMYRMGHSLFSLILLAGAIKMLRTGAAFSPSDVFPRATRPVEFWASVGLMFVASVTWAFAAWFRFTLQ